MKKFEINDRVIELLKQKGLDEVQVATDIGKNASTIYRITNKSTVPSKTTVRLIAEKYGTDPYFLLTGKGNVNASKSNDSVWKDEAYSSLKNELDYLKQKYDQLFDAFLKGNMGKFKALSFSGSLKNDRKRVHVN